jgi:hypothetical protein
MQADIHQQLAYLTDHEAPALVHKVALEQPDTGRETKQSQPRAAQGGAYQEKQPQTGKRGERV